MASAGRHVFTIGHSNHPFEAFLGLLTAPAIDLLVDVRSQPYSRYTPHFTRRFLEPALSGRGVSYRFLGDELGGRPAGAEFYDAAGYVLYGRVARSAPFLAGIERLIAMLDEGRVALLCSEEDPAGCHRRLLVGRVLAERGVAVTHIRGDGGLQSEDEWAARSEGGQLALFEPAEETVWRSTRSVSRRRPPSSSSRR